MKNYKKLVIDDYFPAPKYRENQKEILESILEAWDEGKKFVAIISPTGTGKSIINIAACRMCKDAIYTTPQTDLVRQMCQDKLISPYFKNIMGRRNFICKLSEQDSNMSVISCECFTVET